jgi:hypothetical protein
VVGGSIDLTPAGRALLLNALPPVAHIRASDAAAAVQAVLDRLLDEVTGGRAGSAFAIRQTGSCFCSRSSAPTSIGPTCPQDGWVRSRTSAYGPLWTSCTSTRNGRGACRTLPVPPPCPAPRSPSASAPSRACRR